jgi:O-acetylhomoserine/O-acetylserine sulfhydrylase-like pyridoxal-dependent enzyme
MTDQSQYSPAVQRYIQQGLAQQQAEAELRQRMRKMKFDTIAVDGLYDAQAAQANQGSVIEPAYLSTAQAYENSDHLEAALAYLIPAWTYSRYANPTVHYLEQTLALLEGYGFAGECRACAAGSGMAAIFMACEPFLVNQPGQPPARPNIVASARIYGGTFMLFKQRYGLERGVEVRWVRDPLDLAEWASLIDDHTRFVYSEMPSNPSLAVFDLAGLAEIAHRHELPLLVDSTVATPALLRPLLYGADIVLHSVSKNMATSGLAIAGALIARRDLPSRVGPPELRQDFAAYVKKGLFRDYGPGLSPANALFALTDLRTLRLRMDSGSQAAMQIALFLANHPAVEAVAYPGLASHPGHHLAAQTMLLVDGQDAYGAPVNRYGALLGFCVRGGAAAARRVYDRLGLIWRAADLGRARSLATIPAVSTHQQQGAAGRALAGLPDNLLRLGVGLEHPDDLIADLDQALG